jgi:hypothetical protein
MSGSVSNEPVVTFKLPLTQVNIILQSLGEQPYRVVADVIQAMRVQIVPQVQQAAPGESNLKIVTGAAE